MAEDGNGKDAVTLVAAAFFVPAFAEILLPVPCFLLVTYRCPTLRFLPLFTTAQSKFPFSLLSMKKVPQPLEITVLSSLSAFSIHKVYLELASLSRFLDGNCHSNGHTYHWVVSCTDQTHHFYMSRNGRRTGKLCITVHTSQCIGHTI